MALLVLVGANASVAQNAISGATTVEVRIQLSWSAQPAQGHPLAATVVLQPTDHSGIPRHVQLTTASPAVLELNPGRYQLTATTPLVIDRRAYGWDVELALYDRVNDVRLSQENAVRVGIGDLIEPASLNSATAKPPASKSDTASAAEVKAQIIALLNRWVTSIQARDLRAHMFCYAPELARFLQQRNVSWAQVRAERQKLLRLYPQVRQMQLSDINLTIANGQAVGTAIKKWSFANDDVDWRGAALVNFAFAQIDSRWVITSEWERAIPLESRNATKATSLHVPSSN
jgi:hypothetical protein